MSFAEYETPCINRLAESFEKGVTQTSVNILFDGMGIDDGQKHSVCESLKVRGVMSPTYQMGQKLPYRIEILPASVRERDRIAVTSESGNEESRSRGFLDTVYGIALLWYGDPNARFAKFLAGAGVALITAPWWQPIL